MYYIKFKDPITDLVVESRSASLTEAVSLIQKARDDLYYKGHQNSLEGSSEEDQDSNKSDSVSDENFETPSDIEEDEDNYHEDFFWYP